MPVRDIKVAHIYDLLQSIAMRKALSGDERKAEGAPHIAIRLRRNAFVQREAAPTLRQLPEFQRPCAGRQLIGAHSTGRCNNEDWYALSEAAVTGRRPATARAGAR
jgi:hypothetical protein